MIELVPNYPDFQDLLLVFVGFNAFKKVQNVNITFSIILGFKWRCIREWVDN